MPEGYVYGCSNCYNWVEALYIGDFCCNTHNCRKFHKVENACPKPNTTVVGCGNCGAVMTAKFKTFNGVYYKCKCGRSLYVEN